MEKITNRRKPNAAELKQFRTNLANVIKQTDIPLDINADMHFDNVRFRDNGAAVTIDYGMAMRTAM
jgi:Ser/Thr protein kinase RdoA (MazF antagonist)